MAASDEAPAGPEDELEHAASSTAMMEVAAARDSTRRTWRTMPGE